MSKNVNTAGPAKIVLIDHYDSFTHILKDYLEQASGEEVFVLQHDQVQLEDVQTLQPTHLVLSPGPGSVLNKGDFALGHSLIKHFEGQIPILGVCLGHQGIAHHYGAQVQTAPKILHGKKSQVTHDGTGLFEKLPNPLTVMRYHSLEVSQLPDCLKVTAKSDDGCVMGIEHKKYPIYGLQFHPESFGSSHGLKILTNFLNK